MKVPEEAFANLAFSLIGKFVREVKVNDQAFCIIFENGSEILIPCVPSTTRVQKPWAIKAKTTSGLSFQVAGVKGTAGFGVYAASKAAIRSFVRTWTTDLKDRRIRSNVVSPGPINTPLVSRQSADVIGRIVSTIPMGRMGEPEEVAKVALFLASDDSSFVTGIELFVDGGRAQI